MVQRMIGSLSGGEASPSFLALAACTFLNCHASPPELENSLRQLIHAQRDDGGWPTRWLYYGGYGSPPGFGSEELTAGFCLEALLRFRAQLSQSHKDCTISYPSVAQEK
jgi:hypothetical protein